MRKFKKLVSALLIGAMVSAPLIGCGGGATKSADNAGSTVADSKTADSKADDSKPTDASNPVAGKKVAYIMIMPSATIFQMWKDSCKKLCYALDVKFDFFFCVGDFYKWQDTISKCASVCY